MCDTQHGAKGCPPVCGKVGHIAAGLLWLLGLLSLVAAWLATKNGAVWGLDAAHWYQDVSALGALGVLAALNALFHALKKKHGCGGDEKHGEHGGEKCGCGAEGKCGC